MNFRELMDEFLEVKRDLWGHDTYTDLVSQYNNDIDPAIGSMDINQIKPSHILKMLRSMEGEGHTHKAHRSRARIDQVYRYAIACDYTENNPACSLGDALKPHKTKGHAHLSMHEFGRFLKTVRSGGRLNEIHYDAWLLILYTAKRRSEVAFAEWGEIDFEKKLWNIPAERTKTGKPHTCPLSTGALAVLHRRYAQQRNQYIFPHAKREDRPMNRWMIWQCIRRTGYTGKMTLHGVRKIFSTHSHDSGLWTIDAIETQLSHDIPGVRGIYNKANYLDERRKLVEWWGEVINELLR